MWEETRNRILNNVNNQLRKAVTEIKKNHGQSLNYSYKFNMKKGQ